MDAKTVVAAMVLVMLSAGFLGVSVYLSIRSAPLPYVESREGAVVTQKVTLALLLQLALIIVGVFSWAIVDRITE